MENLNLDSYFPLLMCLNEDEGFRCFYTKEELGEAYRAYCGADVDLAESAKRAIWDHDEWYTEVQCEEGRSQMYFEGQPTKFWDDLLCLF